jgi:hypothetical protein
VAVVVAVDGDDAAEDEEVRNRTTETGPESIPSTRLGIRTGVTQEPVSRINPEENYEYQETDPDNQQPNTERSFHGITPDLSVCTVMPEGSLTSTLNQQSNPLTITGDQEITRKAPAHKARVDGRTDANAEEPGLGQAARYRRPMAAHNDAQK